jgi:hypothetical protein
MNVPRLHFEGPTRDALKGRGRGIAEAESQERLDSSDYGKSTEIRLMDISHADSLSS